MAVRIAPSARGSYDMSRSTGRWSSGGSPAGLSPGSPGGARACSLAISGNTGVGRNAVAQGDAIRSGGSLSRGSLAVAGDAESAL